MRIQDDLSLFHPRSCSERKLKRQNRTVCAMLDGQAVPLSVCQLIRSSQLGPRFSRQEGIRYGRQVQRGSLTGEGLK